MKRLHIYILASTLLFLACGEDPFSTVVEVDPPEFTKKIVLGATLSNDTSKQRVQVTYNQPVIGEATADIYDGLNVQLKHKDNTYTFESEKNKVYYALENPPKWIEGDTYTFHLTQDGIGDAKSSIVYPRHVGLDSLVFVADAGLDMYGDPVSGMDVVFSDPPNERNAYKVYIYMDVANKDRLYSVGIDASRDPIQHESPLSPFIIFDDHTFDGKQHKMRLLFTSRYPETKAKDIFVVWTAIPLDQVVFERRLKQIYNSDDNPFTTPVPMYSNIDGGLGFFTMENRKSYRVK